jgi:serine beta-lactamase-like protein LACTB
MRSVRILRLAAVVAALLMPGLSRAAAQVAPAAAGTSPRWAAAIEEARAFADSLLGAAELPGLSLAVGIDGQVVWTEGFGWADLENQVPVTALTRMRIGSISKSVTAAGMALLYEDGRLDLDAEIQTYVPSFPRKRWPLTVRQVAGHIGGVRHYRDNENDSAVRYPTVLSGLDIFKDDSLLFEPGTRYSYSSYGWNLLSAVMEGASGEEFLGFMEREVFDRLGLRSMVAEHTDSVIDWRASFYERRGGGFINAPYVDNSYKWAGGGFVSNTEDLVRFGMAWIEPGFLDPATVDLWFTPQRLNDGSATTYSMGWGISSDDAGRRVVSHTGGSVGGRAVLVLFPDQGVVVAMLSNAGHAPMSVNNGRRLAAPFVARR